MPESATGLKTAALVVGALVVTALSSATSVAAARAAAAETGARRAPIAIREPARPAVVVVNAWSRATAPGTTVGVVYFEVRNAGAADRLVRLESPVAARVDMHSVSNDGGMMQMRPVDYVDLPAGGSRVFEPGGLHAMLIDLKQPLTPGERIPLTLTFRDAGRLDAVAVVEAMGATGPTSQATVPANAANAAGDYRLTAWPPHVASPHFTLQDAGGRTRTLADYRGRVVVVFFGFVHCPDACPAELYKLALVMKRLGPAADRVQVLFVTLDPARDTPQVLRRYVQAFDSRFVGLTGDAAGIDGAAGSFFVVYARVGTGRNYTIDHSTSTFVLDKSGRLRLVGSTDTTVADYAHDIGALAAE